MQAFTISQTHSFRETEKDLQFSLHNFLAVELTSYTDVLRIGYSSVFTVLATLN